MNSTYQGIEVPCSTDNSDISRQTRRLIAASHAQARPAETKRT
jgi:hypothetical protein